MQTADPKSQRNAGMVNIVLWWLACFGLYLSPWPIHYQRTNIELVSFLFVGVLFIAIVAYRAFSMHAALTPQSEIKESKFWRRVAIIGVFCSLALLIPTVNAYSGFGLNQIASAATDQGAAYQMATDRIDEGIENRSGLVIAQIVSAPFTLISVPYFALSWFARRKDIFLLLLSLLPPITLALVTARDQRVGFAAVLIFAAWLVSTDVRQKRLGARRAIILIGIAVGAAALIASRRVARMGGGTACPPGADVCPAVNSDGAAPAWIQIPASYASQGFEGLGRALYATWNFGGGVSHSPPLSRFVSKIYPLTGADTVSAQLERFGWSSTEHWSTALTSLANDVPWILIPLVIGLQVLLMVHAWNRSKRAMDGLSIGVASLTFLSLVYLPQNLQLAVSGPNYIGYIILVTCYLGREMLAVSKSRSAHTSNRRNQERRAPWQLVRSR